MVKPSLCDYSDAYILVSGTITITKANAMIMMIMQMIMQNR